MTIRSSGSPQAYRPIGQIPGWADAPLEPYALAFAPHGNTFYESDVTAEAIHAAQSTLLRATAFETGALEDLYESGAGVTMSVASEEPGWQERLSSAGADATDRFNDQLKAYEFAREFALSGTEFPLNESFIRQVHEIATASQEFRTVHTPRGVAQRQMVHGAYKVDENLVVDRFGREKLYSPISEVVAEMADLILGARALELAGVSPLTQSAFLQWGIAHIHPFDDGNGRVARIVASVPLFRATGLPFIVFSDSKQAYIQALDAADSGNVGAFVTYVERRTTDSIAWVKAILSRDSTTPPEASLEAIAQLIDAQQVESESAESAARRVRDFVFDRLNQSAATLSNPTVVATSEFSSDYMYNRLNEWLTLTTDSTVSFALTIKSTLPASVKSLVRIQYIGSLPGATHSVRIASEPGGLELFLRHEDCADRLGEEAMVRLGTFVDDIVAKCMARLAAEVKSLAAASGRLPN